MPLDLPSIIARLNRRPSQLSDPPRTTHEHAAVALLLRPSDVGVQLLFIERARRDGDHWSGDMAFPGGRREGIDATIEETVRREVDEEIGVRLSDPVARLDDYDARSGPRPWPLLVSPFVFVTSSLPDVTCNHEVERVIWAPVRTLIAKDSAIKHRFPSGGGHVVVPALRLDSERIVWGMTYRMLRAFIERLDFELPTPE